MATYVYPRARYLTGIVFPDVLLAFAFVLLFYLPPVGPLAAALYLAIPAVLAWGLISLHFPSRVDVTSTAITFHRYGRSHRFDFRAIERIRLRRFLVKDRVLIRIAPSSAWQGRYWILDSIDGFDELVRAIEERMNRDDPKTRRV